jgi:hypothetical protein
MEVRTLATLAGEQIRPRRWPAGLIGALGLILLLEGFIARVPARLDDRSRLGSSWQTAMSRASGPEARAEVLSFGDSLIKLGILPRILEARLGRTAYNLSVLGGQPPTSYLLLRRVLEGGHRPQALIVNFSPLLLGMDPRANLAWWAPLLHARDRLELAWRARDPALLASLILQGSFPSLAHREAIREAVGLSSVAASGGDECTEPDELRALLRNWQINRGAQVAPRSFVPVQGALPRPYDGPGWRWQPHPAHAFLVERFLGLAQERGIPVYWVLTPADAVWLDRNERVGTVGAYRRYVQRQVARYPGLTVLDGQRAEWDRAWFRDPIHLNRDGAIRLSLAVADAIRSEGSVAHDRGRWIELNDGGAVPPREFQDLLEDLDQSRLAVNDEESGPITMEGPRP